MLTGRGAWSNLTVLCSLTRLLEAFGYSADLQHVDKPPSSSSRSLCSCSHVRFCKTSHLALVKMSKQVSRPLSQVTQGHTALK